MRTEICRRRRLTIESSSLKRNSESSRFNPLCIIVDANVGHTMFSRQPTEAGRTVRDWIKKGSGRLIFGGQNAAELFHTNAAKKWVHEAWRAGKARQVRSEAIEHERSLLEHIAAVSCNDAHVLALARASGARVLFTEDNNLIRDFKDTTIIPKPRGWVFRKPDHRKKLFSSKAWSQAHS